MIWLLSFRDESLVTLNCFSCTTYKHLAKSSNYNVYMKTEELNSFFPH